MTRPEQSLPVFETIRTRRVTREFTEQQISDKDLQLIVESARWAPSGGLRRLNVYLIVRNQGNLAKVRAASPGILGVPRAMIVVCVDHAKAEAFAFNDAQQGSMYVDVGTAAQNMLLAAEELGVGACPVMSFHKAAVQILLKLPPALEPVLMIALGYPSNLDRSVRSPARAPALSEIVYWEEYGDNAKQDSRVNGQRSPEVMP